MNNPTPTAQSGPSDRAIAQAFRRIKPLALSNDPPDIVIRAIEKLADEIDATTPPAGARDAVGFRFRVRPVERRADPWTNAGIVAEWNKPTPQDNETIQYQTPYTATQPAPVTKLSIPDWRNDWLLDLMGEWDTPLPTGMFDAIIKSLPLAALTGKADGGDGVSDDVRNALEIADIALSQSVADVGGRWSQHESPRFEIRSLLSLSVEPQATQPAATGAGESTGESK